MIIGRVKPRVNLIGIYLRCSLLASLIGHGSLIAEDSELTNYKSGISVEFSGVKGVDYMEEYRYHDKLVTDAKVVYIKGSTQIAMYHNERNIIAKQAGSSSGLFRLIGAEGLDGVPDSGDEGVIRYKVDRDRWYGGKWARAADSTHIYHPAYAAPISFDELEYESGVDVVGTTGDNGEAISSKNTYYYRGILDSVGDEWHTICVADDDETVPDCDPKEEYLASDGKMFVFVVNPKTPAMTVRATGDGQFYTTPPKVYFNPVIYDQTTYFAAGSGTVTFELKDINGNDVYYRINGGLWQQASNPVLDQDNFDPGVNTLEYYYAGNAAYTKKRTVVKNPTFPSLSEDHGSLLWEDEAEKAKIINRLTRLPYYAEWNRMLTRDDVNRQSYWDANGHQGYRRTTFVKDPWSGSSAASYEPSATNAFVAVVKGNDYALSGRTKSFAEYAKEMLLEDQRVLDNVGWEASWSGNPHPVTELCGAGYYIVNHIMNAVMAYDILIAQYRSDQHSNGITPVEDIFIRDLLASHVYQCMCWNGHYNNMDPGMWGTAQDMAAHVIAFCMDTYSSDYYGTSGFDGNTTTYYNCPFPDVKYTWKQVFSDRNLPTTNYPNLRHTFNVERPDMLVSDPPENYGDWAGPIGYFSSSLMGGRYQWYANLQKLHDPYPIPVVEAAFAKATSGTIYSTYREGSGPFYFDMCSILNSRFPDSWTTGSEMLRQTDMGETDAVITGKLSALLWFDDSLKIGQAEPPTFSQESGHYGEPQTIRMSTNTRDATIRYTIDGSEPSESVGTIFNGLSILVTEDTTFKAIAYSLKTFDSEVVEVSYKIGGTADQIYGLEVVSTPDGEFVESEKLGWLSVDSRPWVWSYSLQCWVYLPISSKLSGAEGVWLYLRSVNAD